MKYQIIISNLDRIQPQDISSHKLAGKIGRTNEELKATYRKLLPEENKEDRIESSSGTNETSNNQELVSDSAFQVLLNLLRNEGM